MVGRRPDRFGYVPDGVPDDRLVDDADWAVPDLDRAIPTDADGPWIDPDVDIWIAGAALCARATGPHWP